jgi:hypothetical protein
MSRIAVQLTADAECTRCDGSGLVTGLRPSKGSGPIRYGGPPRPTVPYVKLCLCVRVERNR